MRSASSRSSMLVAAVLVTSVLIVGGATGAAAARPIRGDVHIVSPMTFPNNGVDPNYGTFTASGEAVDAGLLCPTGDVLDLGIGFAGYQSGQKVQIWVEKRFTCSSGQDSFVMRLQIHAAFDGTETFEWVVRGGTGVYERLRGSGSGVTTDPHPDGNTNTYVGFVIG